MEFSRWHQNSSSIPTYNLYNLSLGLTITKDLLAITKATTKDMGVVCMETTETIIPCTEVWKQHFQLQIPDQRWRLQRLLNPKLLLPMKKKLRLKNHKQKNSGDFISWISFQAKKQIIITYYPTSLNSAWMIWNGFFCLCWKNKCLNAYS